MCVFLPSRLDAVYQPQRRAVIGDTNHVTSFETAKTMTPRFIKTHLPYDLLPRKIRNGDRTPRIVYVARHPKDVVVSLFHHEVLFHGYQGTLDDMVEQYTADMGLYAPHWTHVREFWERRHEPNIHFIKYEDMRKDLGLVIERLSIFLGLGLPDPSVLPKLLEHLSFEAMKSNPYVNKEEVTELLVKAQGGERKSHYIRKGKSGAYREELSPTAIRKLDDWIENNRIEGLYDKDVDLI